MVFILLFMWAPDYFNTMFGPPIVAHFAGYDIPMGVLMLAGAVTLQLIGAYMIFKIISVKV